MIPAEDHAEGDLVTLAQDLSPTEAHLLASCLAAAGLHAVVADADMTRMNPLWSVAVGGAKVRVRATRLAQAQELQQAFERGDFALDDDFDPNAG